MSSFFETVNQANPFKPKHGGFWKTWSSDTKAVGSKFKPSEEILNLPKTKINELVIKSGAFQEAEGEKITIQTVAFVVGSMVTGFFGVQLLESGIANGHTWLLIPCIAACFLIGGIARK